MKHSECGPHAERHEKAAGDFYVPLAPDTQRTPQPRKTRRCSLLVLGPGLKQLKGTHSAC